MSQNTQNGSSVVDEVATAAADLYAQRGEAIYTMLILVIGAILGASAVANGHYLLVGEYWGSIILQVAVVVGMVEGMRLTRIHPVTRLILLFLLSSVMFAYIVVTSSNTWVTVATISIVLMFAGTFVKLLLERRQAVGGHSPGIRAKQQQQSASMGFMGMGSHVSLGLMAVISAGLTFLAQHH